MLRLSLIQQSACCVPVILGWLNSDTLWRLKFGNLLLTNIVQKMKIYSYTVQILKAEN